MLSTSPRFMASYKHASLVTSPFMPNERLRPRRREIAHDGSPLRSNSALPMLREDGRPSFRGPAGDMEPERRLDPNCLGGHLDRLYPAAWGRCRPPEAPHGPLQD